MLILIYIYGAGAFGSRIYVCYKQYIKNFKGFVVSNPCSKSVMGEPVCCIDEVCNQSKNAYIMGLDRSNSLEVLRTKLKDEAHVLCLFDF